MGDLAAVSTKREAQMCDDRVAFEELAQSKKNYHRLVVNVQMWKTDYASGPHFNI